MHVISYYETTHAEGYTLK